MAAGAGDAFLLERLVVVRIRRRDGLFHAVAGNLGDQCRLLVGQRRVAVQTDPDLAVLPPVGAEEGIGKRLGAIGGLPLLVDLAMAPPAFLGSQAGEAGGELLVPDGPGERRSPAAQYWWA